MNLLDYISQVHPLDLQKGVTDCLRQMAELGQHHPDYAYRNFYDFLLREGRFLSSEPLTEDEGEVLASLVEEATKTFFPLEKKFCFTNAQALKWVDHDNVLQYWKA